MRISDWSSDVCSSDLCVQAPEIGLIRPRRQRLGAVITARIDRIARERERLIAQVRDIGRADIARPVGRACRCAAGEILRSRDAALVRGLPGEALPAAGAYPGPVPAHGPAQT